MLLQFGEYSILLVVHGGDAGLLGFGEDVDDQSRVNVEEVLPHHGLIPCQRETAEVLDKPSQWRKKLGRSVQSQVSSPPWLPERTPRGRCYRPVRRDR